MQNEAKIITDEIKKDIHEPKTNSVNSNNLKNTQSTPQLSNEASLALALKSSGSEQEQLLLKLAQKDIQRLSYHWLNIIFQIL